MNPAMAPEAILRPGFLSALPPPPPASVATQRKQPHSGCAKPIWDYTYTQHKRFALKERLCNHFPHVLLDREKGGMSDIICKQLSGKEGKREQTRWHLEARGGHKQRGWVGWDEGLSLPPAYIHTHVPSAPFAHPSMPSPRPGSSLPSSSFCSWKEIQSQPTPLLPACHLLLSTLGNGALSV